MAPRHKARFGGRHANIDANPRKPYNYAPFPPPTSDSQNGFGTGTFACKPAAGLPVLQPITYIYWSLYLANIKSAKKRARQAVKRNARNSSARSALRTAVKKVVNAIAAKDKPAAEAAYKAAEPVLDRSYEPRPDPQEQGLAP